MKNDLGQRGELFVQDYIKKQGWEIKATNVHSRFGEIDIIAQDKKELVFIEVKTRANTSYGLPQESVTSSKLRKITMTAQWYMLQQRKEGMLHRFDVFSVLEKDGILSVEHFKNVSLS
jgi:putative endonuclease